MNKSHRARLIGLAREHTLISAKEVTEAGIHSQHLTRLVAEGVLERVAPGTYRLADGEITEHHSLAIAGSAAPHGVICLISALSFHGIGSQLPAEVWLAVERGRRAPRIPQLPLRVVRFSGPGFRVGIETHEIEGRQVRVYGVAKTLADLFKMRSWIGVEVAVEALREAWRDRRFAMAELDQAAQACRVAAVVQPYIEGIVV